MNKLEAYLFVFLLLACTVGGFVGGRESSPYKTAYKQEHAIFQAAYKSAQTGGDEDTVRQYVLKLFFTMAENENQRGLK